ncbi:MAG: hypothetical protein A3G92_00485 [Deltaproteobacteria bacterium RIFCSPLOWO2_12_FULL_38_8]|nr:MAG: hypothetical protein A3G92_00485 [Deltaproteobacteria bacterium RIFCSPLOWO2_12_FULL_38_8]
MVLGLFLIPIFGNADEPFVWKDPQTVYTWDDAYLFQYAQKLSELKKDRLKDPKRVKALQLVIEELGMRGRRLDKDDTFYAKAIEASGLLHEKAVKDEPYLYTHTGSILHNTMERIASDIKRKPQLTAENKAPLINYYKEYGQSRGQSRDVLEATQQLVTLGDKSAAAQMFERYGEHFDIPSDQQAQRVVQAIKKDPRLFEIAQLAIVEGEEEGHKTSPLEYSLFEYTKAASSDDKKLLAPIWQEALLVTKKPANQYQWANYLLEQNDPKSIDVVFNTHFRDMYRPDQIDENRTRQFQKKALDNMDPPSVLALAQQDARVMTGPQAAAPFEPKEGTLTADQFQMIAQHLREKGKNEVAREAAKKSLLATPQGGVMYSNNASLGILIDLARENDLEAQRILTESFSNPKTTLNDRDRIFMLQDMGQAQDSRFKSFFLRAFTDIDAPLPIDLTRTVLKEIKSEGTVDSVIRQLSEKLSQANDREKEKILGGKLMSLGTLDLEGYRAVLRPVFMDMALRRSAFSNLIREREKLKESTEALKNFDNSYKQEFKDILRNPSNEELALDVLNYFKGEGDNSIVEDLNVAAQTMVQDSQMRKKALSCGKGSYSYQLPSALIELSSPSDEQSALSLVSLFKEGAKTSCPRGDLNQWLSDIEKGFGHFEEGVQAKIVVQLEEATKDESLSSTVRERLTLAAKNLKPKEEVAETCPVNASEEMVDIRVPKALLGDAQKLAEYIINQEKNK